MAVREQLCGSTEVTEATDLLPQQASWSNVSPHFPPLPLCADMEKFPLRMKDNDLLVTELFQDPSHDPITSLSVYLTPALCECLDCHSHSRVL